MFDLDLSNVKETSFGLLPEGTYEVVMDDCSVKQTKSGTGEYINCKYRVIKGDAEGRFLFHTFNFKNDNAKATEIGLSQLKAFMKCAGVKSLHLTNVLDLVGLRCNAVVKTRSDSYGEKNVISYFKPLSPDNGASAQGTPSSGAPF